MAISFDSGAGQSERAGLREMGLLVAGSPKRDYESLSLGDKVKMVAWADELHGWPVEERVHYINEHPRANLRGAGQRGGTTRTG